VVLLALVASTSGCIDDFDDPKGYGATGGSDRSGGAREGCFEICERAASCQSELDCKRQCVDFEAEVEAAGCSEEYADLIDCALEVDDICTSDDACEASIERFAICLM
jgi:hypothetical protein